MTGTRRGKDGLPKVSDKKAQKAAKGGVSKRKTVSSQDVIPPNPHDRHALIQMRAYEIWEEEGRPRGRDVVHWRRAEEEFRDRELVSVPGPTIHRTPKAEATRGERASPAQEESKSKSK